jgi:hypothetical protein
VISDCDTCPGRHYPRGLCECEQFETLKIRVHAAFRSKSCSRLEEVMFESSPPWALYSKSRVWRHARVEPGPINSESSRLCTSRTCERLPPQITPYLRCLLAKFKSHLSEFRDRLSESEPNVTCLSSERLMDASIKISSVHERFRSQLEHVPTPLHTLRRCGGRSG